MKRWISVCAMLALACFAAADDHVAAGIAWAAGAVGFPAIDGNAVLQHTRVLSSAEFEGRFPGTKGEDLTVAYIENQFPPWTWASRPLPSRRRCSPGASRR